MSNIPDMPAAPRSPLPEAIQVKRSDPVYMAHAYLTKVPVPGVMPFIEAFTKPGDIVLDPFAGSGMTGVAAMVLGRHALLFDVSVLGRHIGQNYSNLVDAPLFRTRSEEVIAKARADVGGVYAVACHRCSSVAQLAKTVWSAVMRCAACAQEFNYYRTLEAADWVKAAMTCPWCAAPVGSRSERTAEEPVIDSISCACSRKQIEQEWSEPLQRPASVGLDWPDEQIESTRQMYVASALGRHGLTSTAKFYSTRNLSVLAALRRAIDDVDEPDIRQKLLFAFTAILSRASKRYQWSRQRPLNASNSNYYVAPVFYEWNVFELFGRKIEAALKSDAWIEERSRSDILHVGVPVGSVRYELASADALPVADASVDYVFTDPPFGSNIFYSDMNLFQEAWLGETTDEAAEAVVDRVDTGSPRTAERYEQLLTDALRECKRVLRDGGLISLVFGNSAGHVWQLLQRAIDAAGLEVMPEHIVTLDKGQRSVKGLASGFENVTTLDLVLTMREADRPPSAVSPVDQKQVASLLAGMLEADAAVTPSHLYLELLREGFRRRWDLSDLDLGAVTDLLRSVDRGVDRRSAAVTRGANESDGRSHGGGMRTQREHNGHRRAQTGSDTSAPTLWDEAPVAGATPPDAHAAERPSLDS